MRRQRTRGQPAAVTALDFRLVADRAPAMIRVSDANRRSIWFNQTWLNFVGRPMEAELGEGWTAHVHPEDLARYEETYQTAWVARKSFSIEYRLRRSDGVFRWLSDSGVPLMEHASSFSGYICSCVDITDRKRTEEALRESEERFRLMAETAPVMIWMSDEMGRCLHVNRRLREFWNLESSELVDFDWLTRVHPDDAEDMATKVARALRDRTDLSTQARFRSAGGHYRVFQSEARPRYSPSGDFLGLIGINIDITETVEANDALRQSEERFERFMQHLPGLAWIKDLQGRYVFVNEAAGRIFSRSKADVLGRSDDELFPPHAASQFKQNDQLALSRRTAVQVIETLRHRDGTLHHSLVSKFPIPGADGGVSLIGGIAIDITDRKAAEDRVAALNEDLSRRLEEQEALLRSLPVGVFISRDAKCEQISMNTAGANVLRLPQSANASKSGPGAPALPFRILKNGVEVPPADLTMQRAARLAQPVVGDEVDVEFSNGDVITLYEYASPLFDEAGKVRGCVGVFVDITERKRAEMRQKLLIDELNHRVKNALAIVQSVAAHTLRTTPEPEAFKHAFAARLGALAQAHSLLTRSYWTGVSLADLLTVALSPFELSKESITLQGPPVTIKPNSAVTLALVLHELGTNAGKYGSLSTPNGRLSVAWDLLTAPGQPTHVDICWRETNGPPVRRPVRSGFGTRLITASGDQLGGTVELDFRPEGLVARFRFKLDEPQGADTALS